MTPFPPDTIRAALIDLDGTLVDTLGDFTVALHAMLGELALPALSRADIERRVGKGSAIVVGRFEAPDEAAAQAELKRVKESERGVQGFHRWGSVILEVVERRLVQPRDTTSGVVPQSPSDATYWGLVLIVDDIEAVCAHLGPDVISAPKPAVQPGRLIATVRSGAGLGVPLALMSR